jgi:hypothetical protein
MPVIIAGKRTLDRAPRINTNRYGIKIPTFDLVTCKLPNITQEFNFSGNLCTEFIQLSLEKSQNDGLDFS